MKSTIAAPTMYPKDRVLSSEICLIYLSAWSANSLSLLKKLVSFFMTAWREIPYNLSCIAIFPMRLNILLYKSLIMSSSTFNSLKSLLYFSRFRSRPRPTLTLAALQNRMSEANQIEGGGQYFPMIPFIIL